MKVYTTDKIRNVVLLGHGGSGKTSLAESFAYLSGITSRMGKISDGNTISDYSKEEQKRQFSISCFVFLDIMCPPLNEVSFSILTFYYSVVNPIL